MKPSSKIHIVHQDHHLLVVSKPPGLATTAPGNGDCLTKRLNEGRRVRAGQRAIHASSRLDSPVSGLVTYAQTDKAIAALKEARDVGRYRRRYLALSLSSLESSEGSWTWPIGMNSKDVRLRQVAVPGRSERIQEAKTDYSSSAHSGVTLLVLEPHTGRTHQLRVHAEAAGCPLLGDVSYGGNKRVTLTNGRVLSARRVMLHCALLNIPDVANDGELALRLPPPEDFVSLFTSLGGTAAALEDALKPFD
ncbi:MAG: 23S rRNA-/tRNA-specific pseudouridylate synthase [Polyangiales bacterium]|jgi:23S rRNA-/tRNA-specific pseudouridylate synthase